MNECVITYYEIKRVRSKLRKQRQLLEFAGCDSNYNYIYRSSTSYMHLVVVVKQRLKENMNIPGSLEICR